MVLLSCIKYLFFLEIFFFERILSYEFPIDENDVAKELDRILAQGVKDKVYPGVAAMAGTLDGSFLYSNAIGHYKYIEDGNEDGIKNNKIQIDSIFDLASCSKVVAGTSAVALLYQRGYFTLDTRISDILGSEFNQGGKENVTVLNCLLHNAGFNPDPVPWYYDLTFGCPNSDDSLPEEDFSCLDKIYPSFMNETLAAPPGDVFKYSDLSLITLSIVVGKVVLDNKLISSKDLHPKCLENKFPSTLASILCQYEGFVRKNVFHFPFPPSSSNSAAVLMPSTQFLVPTEQWPLCVPTINDTLYLHKRPQGQVSDGNTYAMGGISGHAGVFSTIEDLSNLARNLLTSYTMQEMEEEGEGVNLLLNSTTIHLFTKQYNTSQSSRALGWDTNSYDINDYGYTNACGTLSPSTFMHIGYTGTCICIDPILSVWTVILTNRVYNCNGQSCPSDSSDAVKAVYRSFNSMVKDTVSSKKH